MNMGNIYQNTDFSFNNGQLECYCNKNKIDINSKLNDLFKTNSYRYKIKLHIKTNETEFDSIIIGKTNTKLVTINNKLINIRDIIDFKLI